MSASATSPAALVRRQEAGAVQADKVLREALGEAVIDTVAAVRRGEFALFENATAEEIVAATRWRH